MIDKPKDIASRMREAVSRAKVVDRQFGIGLTETEQLMVSLSQAMESHLPGPTVLRLSPDEAHHLENLLSKAIEVEHGN